MCRGSVHQQSWDDAWEGSNADLMRQDQDGGSLAVRAPCRLCHSSSRENCRWFREFSSTALRVDVSLRLRNSCKYVNMHPCVRMPSVSPGNPGMGVGLPGSEVMMSLSSH